MIKRYGFLYGGYAFCYWEVADMIRKLAIAAVPVFIKVQPLGSLQAVLGEIVLVIYIFATSYVRPFSNSHDNLLQVGSMIGVSYSPLTLAITYGRTTLRGMPIRTKVFTSSLL